jgi:hypothetical protein
MYSQFLLKLSTKAPTWTFPAPRRLVTNTALPLANHCLFYLPTAGSLEMYASIAHDQRESLLETEAAWLRATRADLVLSDVVPVVCTAAKMAGIPSVCISNFSWGTASRRVTETPHLVTHFPPPTPLTHSANFLFHLSTPYSQPRHSSTLTRDQHVESLNPFPTRSATRVSIQQSFTVLFTL